MKYKTKEEKKKEEAKPKKPMPKIQPNKWELNDTDFKNFMDQMTKEQLVRTIADFKSNRDFYKKVLEEDYRAKAKGTFRYDEAERFISLINMRGKQMSEKLKLM